ncbi:MAG: type III secretion system inner membrane ring subunit SctD [Simkaniaceae bacterium]|nr:type III secretion system inner membrane ring subunit SctD [Simkaniaceae bacterium]
MPRYLVAEEGPLAGLIVRLEDGEEWIIGRDPDVCFQVIEDPMVSRKHVIIKRLGEDYFLENLSATNPASVNGIPVEEQVPLQEDDTVQIGNVLLRFTNSDPAMQADEIPREVTSFDTPTIFEEEEALDTLSFTGDIDAKWLIKIISGPNAGAEFGVHPGSTYIIGKDSSSCDIVFQDLSVSRQHAKLSSDESGDIFIEDMDSRNGILVNGSEITEKKELISQDLIALGTTTILIIDREQSNETIVSLPLTSSGTYPEFAPAGKEEPSAETPIDTPTQKNWKDLFIPTRHIVIGVLFVLLILIGAGGVFSLFNTQTVQVEKKDEAALIEEKIKQFPGVVYSYNPSSGKLFLIGHVLREINQQELTYNINSLSFIQSIENNVVIDELVWESFNDMLIKNPNWRGVNVTAMAPGRFILRGYLETTEEATKLAEYVNSNFPYLNKLDNQVAIENILKTEIESILLTSGLVNVSFQLSNGEVILSGLVGHNATSTFEEAISAIKKISGVRLIKNFAIVTSQSTERINLSAKFQVSGSSKVGKVNQYIVINGKILSDGDNLEGMQITAIESNAVLLEKDGIKYQINYNQQ